MSAIFMLVGLYLFVGVINVSYDFTRLREPYRSPGYVRHPSPGAVFFAVLLWPALHLQVLSDWGRMGWTQRFEVLALMGNLLGGAAACVSGSFLILASDSTTVMRVLKIAAILGVYAAAVWWMQSLVRSRAERWSRG